MRAEDFFPVQVAVILFLSSFSVSPFHVPLETLETRTNFYKPFQYSAISHFCSQTRKLSSEEMYGNARLLFFIYNLV